MALLFDRIVDKFLWFNARSTLSEGFDIMLACLDPIEVYKGPIIINSQFVRTLRENQILDVILEQHNEIEIYIDVQ